MMIEVTQEWCEERKRLLPGELLRMIEQEPGLPKTEYLHRPLVKGGLRGLTDDKYDAFDGLLSRGLIKFGPDSKRRWHVRGVYLATAELPPPVKDRHMPDDEGLMKWLVEEVERNPGLGPTYYPRVPKAQGSPGGSQERKELLLERLIAQGRLRLERLPKAQGRRTVGVFLAGGLPSVAG
jgi:hypothetical protein